MKNSNVKHRLSRLLGGLCGAVMIVGLSGCTDDLLEGTPEWLGTSIYEELETRGDYTTTLALINSSPVASDNYRQILSLTGSKTLFVADDAAWQRFFEKNKTLSEVNPWHTITSVESFNAPGNELKVRRLFKGMMLNNAYVLDLLGNLSTDPSAVNNDASADACMRRTTSISNLDMRGEITSENFPPEKLDNASGVKDIDWWIEVRDKDAITTMPAVLNGKNNTKPASASYLYTSNGNADLATMVHFSPSFAVSKGFTSEDVSILSGGNANSTSQTVVNGVAVDPDNSNITCQNGYIHKLVEVPYPVSNMMEKLSYEPNYSIFYKQLQRFSYPYRNAVQMKNIGSEDSVYTIRYMNSGDYAKHCALTANYDNDKTATSYLPYDPAWNQYYLNAESYEYAMDAALMLVPNDQQMTSFLTNEGIDLTNKYAAGKTPSWDLYPDAIVAELMQNCMIPNFLSYLPSNVDKIKDTSQSQIKGLDASKIGDCFVCGNGVIYGLTMNIVPPSYKDVTSTMLLNKEKDLDESRDEGFSVFYSFIQKDKDIPGASAGYASYLSSFDGTSYVLFCPYDKAMRKVIDPSSLTRTGGSGSETGPVLYDYKYDGDKYLPYAVPERYIYDATTGIATPTGEVFARMSNYDVFAKQSDYSSWYKSNAYKLLKYIIENGICPVEDVAPNESPLVPAYTYYKTKSGSAIKVDWAGGSNIANAGYAGGHQTRFNRFVKSPSAAVKANGVSLPVAEVLLPSTISPYKLIQAEFPDFFSVLNSGTSQSKYLAQNDGNTAHKILDATDFALSMLRPYNYTIYIPTKAAMDSKVNRYELTRRSWYDAIGPTDDVIKTNFSGISNYPDDLKELKDLRDSIKQTIENFIAYHVQDNGIYVGQKEIEGVFETSLVNLETNQFYGLHVEEDPSSKTLEVYPKGDTSQKVEVDIEKCNLMATQNFYIESTGNSSSEKLGLGQIYSSSYVVLHQIKDNKDFSLPAEINPWDQSKYERLKELFDKYGVTLPDPVQN
jgi:hypothetical protein